MMILNPSDGSGSWFLDQQKLDAQERLLLAIRAGSRRGSREDRAAGDSDWLRMEMSDHTSTNQTTKITSDGRKHQHVQ